MAAVVKEPQKETSATCISCGDAFTLDDEVFLATIRFLVVGASVLEQHLVVDDHGDFMYEPLFFHIECWEAVVDELREAYEDIPPLEHGEAVRTCTFCKSGVLQWEYFARANIGEFHRSQKSPDGNLHHRFISFDKNEGSLMCLSCMAYVRSEVLEIWGEVTQDGECDDCAHDRCWRDGDCDCDCHEEGQESDE